MDSSSEAIAQAMATRKVASIFETFFLFYKISSCLGFMPIRVNGENISKRSVYYSLFFFFIYTTMWAILCILGQQEPDAEESLLIRYGSYMVYLNSIAFVAFVVLFNYLK